MIGGVSGGERKRVAVGYELLTNPSILMLDEPTSGLDATAAMHLITILRNLAESGRSVVTTIHQPSSRLYQKLDTLLLLSEGQRLYYGDAKLVMGWFQALGRPVPLGVNIADFILDLANGDLVDDHKTGEESRQELVASFLAFAGQRTTGIGSEKHIDRFKQGLPFDDSDSGDKAMRNAQGLPSNPSAEKWGAGFFEQLTVLWSRTLRTRRFETFSILKIIELFGMAVISGLLWFQEGRKNTLLAASDITGLLFFIILFQQVNSLYNALFRFPSEFQIMRKERSSGMYRLSAFYISRTASELPMDCFIPTLCVFATYWLAALRPTATAFLSHWFGVLLSILVAQTVGLLVGALVIDFERASTISTLMIMTMMLAGGFYIRTMPNWISWAKYCSFIFYGFNLLMKIEFHGREYLDCGELQLICSSSKSRGSTGDCKPVESLKDALGLAVDVDDSVAFELIVLFGTLAGLRVLLYYVLKFKTKA